MTDYAFRRLLEGDAVTLKNLLTVFGEAFEDKDAYQSAVPHDDYLNRLLARPDFVALVAMKEAMVVGGLAAYELQKFEQNRRELYIYDLAVLAEHRRKGIATSLVDELKRVALQQDAYVIYVQADRGDDPAIRLYDSLGTKEEVFHFDIPVES